MPKISPKDKLLFAVDQARRAFISKRPILEDLTDDKDFGEVIAINLDRAYKHRYNPYLAQLHYIGSCIKYYKSKEVSPTDIRKCLGITRQQFYLALAIFKSIQEPDAIPYLEEVSPKDFRLTEKELDYVRYGAWPEHINPDQEAQQQKEKEDHMKALIKDLLGDRPNQE
jgi:hypothetical protein